MSSLKAVLGKSIENTYLNSSQCQWSQTGLQDNGIDLAFPALVSKNKLRSMSWFFFTKNYLYAMAFIGSS